MAARLKKQQQRVNLEPPRPMAARLKKTSGRLRTAPAYGRAVNELLIVFYLFSHYTTVITSLFRMMIKAIPSNAL